MKTNAAPANGKVVPTRCFADLEEQVSCLRQMALVTADLLDRNLKDIRTLCGRARNPADSWQIILTNEQMQMLCLAWNDLVTRTQTLEREYFAILDGGEA